jgi:hypothetical protein
MKDTPMNGHAKQVEILRQMSPARKLELAAKLLADARELKRAYLRQLHPEWSEQELKAKVRESFLYART